MKEPGLLFDSRAESEQGQVITAPVPQPEFQLQRQSAPPRTAVRRLAEIKPIPAIEKLGFMPTALQLEPVRACGDRPFDEFVLITDEGFLVDGYKRWLIARELEIPELACVVLSISKEEALIRVLGHACGFRSMWAVDSSGCGHLKRRDVGSDSAVMWAGKSERA